MPTYCYVNQCSSIFEKGNNIKFHEFPKDERLRQLWIKAIRTRKNPSLHSKVCSKHFKESDYVQSYSGHTNVLRKNCVPSQKLPLRSNRRPKLKTRFGNKTPTLPIKNEINSLDSPETKNITAGSSVDVVPIEIKINTSDTTLSEIDALVYSEDVKPIKIEIPQPVKSSSSDTSIEWKSDVDHLTAHTVDNYTQTATYYEIPLNILVENLSQSEIKYFTGFERNRLDMLYTALNITSNVYDNGLNCKNQLVLTLIKYRRNIDFILIAKLYNLRRQAVFKIFQYWTKAIYAYMKKIDFWKLRHTNPTSYTAIIDCTEIFTEHSSLDPNVNQELFSNYKNQNTFKYLVAIDENGLLIFCSKVYGGSKSDRFIIEDSCFLDHLNSGDIILADRGFNISDLLEKKNVALNIPPFKRAPQFEPEEILETRTLARIHVERVINLTKKNKILSSKIPTSLWPIINEIVFNANVLCNF